jgi:bacteriorhodopsin
MAAIAVSFLIFLVGTIIFIIKAYNSKEQSRYYFLAMYICAFSAAMSYLAMLSGEGWIAITGCRQFFYARYAKSLITLSARYRPSWCHFGLKCRFDCFWNWCSGYESYRK